MANFNKVFLMGNMTRDPELRYTPNGTPLCEFGMAINRRWTSRDGETKEETCFVDVTMWGRRGEVISEYFSKGQPIFIEGRLKLDRWETADGKRSKLSVVAENFEFIGSSRGESGSSQSGQGRQQRRSSTPERSSADNAASEGDDVEEAGYDVSDDEIPF